MRPFESILYKAARRILRLGMPMILVVLLYTCYYIYNFAPDGGVMTSFYMYVAELLGNALASLGLLIASAAIPDVRPI